MITQNFVVVCKKIVLSIYWCLFSVYPFPVQLNIVCFTVRTELHRHPEVPTLSTYIQWKTEDDHTYHNRQNEIKMNLNLFYNCFICFNVSKK